MGRQRKYDEQTRAAVIAALLTGQSVSSVAAEYNIPKGTVNAWKEREAQPARTAAMSNSADALGETLQAYVIENVNALRNQLKVFGDESWVRKQHAQELAVLHGVMTDKAVRLLEAMSRDD